MWARPKRGSGRQVAHCLRTYYEKNGHLEVSKSHQLLLNALSAGMVNIGVPLSVERQTTSWQGDLLSFPDPGEGAIHTKR